jgi:GT2 family glycosyltransferase
MIGIRGEAARGRVTVVTPSFNQAAYLAQAMGSVLSQNVGDLEYIVVDGGSTDGTISILRRYDRQLAWWVSEPDEGQAAALKKGFAVASGEFLAWLNSDDLLQPNCLQRAVSVLQRSPEIDLVYGNCISIDSRGEIIRRARSRQWSLLDLLCMRIISQPTVVFRRKAYERAGGMDATFHLLMDHDLWLRIAAAGQIMHVDEVWAGARVHAEAKNSRCRMGFREESRRLLEKYERSDVIGPAIAEHRRLIEGHHEVFAGVYALAGEQHRQALRRFGAALVYAPTTLTRSWRPATQCLLRGLGLGLIEGWARRFWEWCVECKNKRGPRRQRRGRKVTEAVKAALRGPLA